ncbi:hypothetical protein JI664_04065 [Rhodobacter sp. NTK016B]|uniref:hypothetical protein n=1 Tax=Rhodobacter sp. NTK016B TaxID=2759676 RepID=UPI001A9044E5|nr:hypothetical protein [Rhodobacter sp. NTK016B]MBN8291134.1 hypothetical protein [Rhodobacter sp. NTK016B]
MSKKTKSPAAKPAKAAVLVLGMHRSGTSALAGVLSKLGCELPQAIMEPSQSNAKGFFESTAVRDLNDEILASAGTAWDDFLVFNPHWHESPVAATYFQRAVDLVHADFGDSPLIVLKDPRICRLVPFWTRVLEQAGRRVLPILTVRHPEEVARSLRTKKKFSRALSHMIWLHYVLEAEVQTRGTVRYATSYDMLIRRWPRVVSEAEKALGLRWPRGLDQVETIVEDFLSTDLRHHQERPDEQSDNPLLVNWLRDTYAIFTRWAEQGEDSADYETLDAIRASFNDAARAFGRVVKAEREQTRSLGEQITTLETARETQQKRADDALTKQQAEAKKLSDANAQLAKRTEDVARLESALAARQEQLEDERTGRQKDKDALTKKLLAARDEAAAAAQKLADAMADSEARAQEIHRLEAALAIKSERATASERERAILEAQHKTLAEEFEAQRAQVGTLKEAASARDQELAQLTMVITENDREISRLGKELTEAEAQAEARKAEFDALTDELSQVRSALTQRQHETETTAAELSEAKAELAREAEAAERLRTDLETARKAGREMQDHLQDRFREVATLTQYAMKQQGEIDTLHSQVTSLGDKVADSENANAVLNRDSAQRVSEIAALHVDLSSLRYDLSTARQERDALEREVAALRSSTSWRITGPLRRMIRLVRRGG